MRYRDCTKTEKERIKSLGFYWCGADGFVCHLSKYKNEDEEFPCDYCPRKRDWEENGVYELPNGFKLIK